MEDIVWFSFLFLAIQLFALPAYKGLDYNAKTTNKNLLNIKKVKWLFVRYKVNKDKIGICSFIFQTIHLILNILLLTLSIFYIITKIHTLFIVTITIYISYLAFTFLFMIIVTFLSIIIDEKSKKTNKDN